MGLGCGAAGFSAPASEGNSPQPPPHLLTRVGCGTHKGWDFLTLPLPFSLLFSQAGSGEVSLFSA